MKNFLQARFKDTGIKLVPKMDGREGVDFIFETITGNLHEVYLQPINLNKERSIKILKQDLGEPKGNLWVALVLILDNEAIGLYMIPSKTIATPDDYIFIENEVSSFPHLTNWEIKVFQNGMQKLSEFSLDNILNNL